MMTTITPINQKILCIFLHLFFFMAATFPIDPMITSSFKDAADTSD